MKEATGELNMTVITIIVIGLVLTFFMTILWPNIQKQINEQWGSSTDNTQTGPVTAPTTNPS